MTRYEAESHCNPFCHLELVERSHGKSAQTMGCFDKVRMTKRTAAIYVHAELAEGPTSKRTNHGMLLRLSMTKRTAATYVTQSMSRGPAVKAFCHIEFVERSHG